MADEAEQHREAAAEAQARGDSAAANAAYAEELAALARGDKPQPAEPTDPLSDVLGPADDTGDDEDPSEAAAVEDLDFDDIEAEPTPAELTSKVYEDFAQNYDDDQAAELQARWGNDALENARLTGALVEDLPVIEEIYQRHQTEDGDLPLEGFGALANAAVEAFGVKSVEDLDGLFPEAEAIFWQHFDENRGFSPVGFQELLLHAAKQRGYRFKFHHRRTK